MDNYKILTESMFYVLLAFKDGEKSGVDIVQFTNNLTGSRVPLAPGTLYSILSKFEDDKLIKEIDVDGRKRTYEITPLGIKVLENELVRLNQLVSDAKGVLT